MKFLKQQLKSLIIILLIIFVINVFFLKAYSKSQYMNHLNYDIELLEDGKMRVTETWDIYINRTNTIFRNITIKDSYTDITNVSVIDLDTGKNLTQIYEEMYHVTRDCFYALNIESDVFEIAWGTGMEESSGNKRYQITYEVNNVINSYNDCQEWYWQLLEEGKNAIPVRKVTGTITLPSNVQNMDNLRVWGHGQINGNIEKVNTNTVKFEIKNLQPKAMLELRIVTLDKMFNVIENKTNDYNKLNSIINEETNWANQTNLNAQGPKIFIIVFFIIYIFFIIKLVIKIIRYIKVDIKENSGVTLKEIKYYRDIPREKDSTPNEAVYLYNFNKRTLDNKKVQAEMISSTILDLVLKKIIALSSEKDKIYVKILVEKPENLKPDELEVFFLLKHAGEGKERFEIKDLNKFAKRHYQEYSDSINKLVNSARNSLYNLKLIDKKQESLYATLENKLSNISYTIKVYEFFIIFLLVTYIPPINSALANNIGVGMQNNLLGILIIMLPLAILNCIKWSLQSRKGMSKKIAVLTQEGADEKEKWKALARYMLDYSLIEEKGVLDLVLWEKYLVYATAFGISDKVIEELKAKYPQVFIKEEWEKEDIIQKYPVMHFVINPENEAIYTPISYIGSSVKTAYSTSIRQISIHNRSSGYGGGGGFSSGGGRWRRRRPEWAEDK